MEMEWGERRADSFEKFVEAVSDILPTKSSPEELYWFRGQSNVDWNLEPSFMRYSGGLDLPVKVLTDLEDEARKAFRSKAHLFVSPHLLDKVKTIPCWWALMQHHGAPTRLLDWTLSPYVAAYFAAQQDRPEGSGAVWCFCSSKLRQAFKDRPDGDVIPDCGEPNAPTWFEDKLKKLNNQEIVIPLSITLASSERMVAQQGRFTMCFKIHQQHNCIISQIGREFLRKIVIPKEKKAEILLRLRDMNITGASLYPGVDGLGLSVREIVSLGAYYNKGLSESRFTCSIRSRTESMASDAREGRDSDIAN
jgi:hypothetical protein